MPQATWNAKRERQYRHIEDRERITGRSRMTKAELARALER